MSVQEQLKTSGITVRQQGIVDLLAEFVASERFPKDQTKYDYKGTVEFDGLVISGELLNDRKNSKYSLS